MVVELQTDDDLEQLLERSKTHPVVIFKHSTQCSISSDVYGEFKHFTETAPDADCGVVLVIENRNLSNEIAGRLGVRHESPQALLVKDGRPVWNASHWSITADSLGQALASYAQSPHQRN